MIAALMVATLSASAQNEVGQLTLQPKVGINIANVTGDIAIDKKSKVGFVAGFEAEYGISEIFGLDFGVLYSMEGFKAKSIGIDGYGTSAYLVDANYNLDYINIPILAQVYPVKGLAIKAGIQFGFLTSKKATIDGVKYDIDKIEAAFGASAGFRKFDVAIPMGISYEFKHFVLDARYNLGLLSTVKDIDDTYRNSVFQFSLGYKIPFSD